MKRNYVTPILERVAREMGIEIHLEPLGYVGMLTAPDGRKRYFRDCSFDLNTLGAGEIAHDKAYAAYFLGLHGYPVPIGRLFFTDRWCRRHQSDDTTAAACDYVAAECGWPVVVKPNSRSLGLGVFKVSTSAALQKAARSISALDHAFLVQQVVSGREYRVDVLDGEVIRAYERYPLSVVGNGVSSVNDLLDIKQQAFERSGEHRTIPVTDSRIGATLREQGMTRGSIIPRGSRVVLLPNANYSTGGDTVDITDSLHPEWIRLSAQIAADMNLRYVGIDFVTKASLSEVPAEYVVLEINRSANIGDECGLDEHGKACLEVIYRKVIAAMFK